MREEYQNYIKGNKLLTILKTLNAITRTISLLMTDVKTCRLVGVSRDDIEEALKCLKIIPKMLSIYSNAMWDILLATEEKTKQLTRNILMTKQ